MMKLSKSLIKLLPLLLCLWMSSLSFGQDKRNNQTFLLYALIYQQQMGIWMNEPLYKETIRQAKMEDYCRKDREQCYRRLQEVSAEAEEGKQKLKKTETSLLNGEEVIKGQSILIDNCAEELESTEKAMNRWRRIAIGSPVVVFLGGVVTGVFISN